jgi:hypothetical protein
MVGRFVVLGLIGRGGMGTVYRPYDLELDRNSPLPRSCHAPSILRMRASGLDSLADASAELGDRRHRRWT